MMIQAPEKILPIRIDSSSGLCYDRSMDRNTDRKEKIMQYPTEGARFHAETGKTVSQAVMDAEFTDTDSCTEFAGLLMNRALNTGGGRPSDAARYVVSLHQSLGCDGLRARYLEGANSKSLETAAGSLGLNPGGLR